MDNNMDCEAISEDELYEALELCSQYRDGTVQFDEGVAIICQYVVENQGFSSHEELRSNVQLMLAQHNLNKLVLKGLAEIVEEDGEETYVLSDEGEEIMRSLS
jgi:hypothetical protein